MMKSKKSQVLVYGLIFGFFIAVGTFYMTSYLKELPDEYLGEKSLNIIKAASEAEKALFYIDLSAKYAVYKTTKELSRNGGYSTASGCGTYLGYNLWNNEDKTCYPNKEMVKENFKSIFNDDLNLYLKKSPLSIPINNYEIRLKQNEKLEMIGIALIPFGTGRIFVIEKKYIVPASVENMIKKIIEEYGGNIEFASETHDVDDESLIPAIIAQESGGDPSVISGTGCAGLMQFCYCTAWSYSSLGVSPSCINAGYSKTGSRIFNKLKSCACTGSICKISPTCNERNDDRFDPEKSINAGAKYLSQLEEEFKKYTYKEEFAIASYNGGASVIKNAIKKTGKEDPTWNEVEEKLTYDLITYFEKEGEKKDKVKEIKNYVLKVNNYRKKYAEIERGETTSKIATGAVIDNVQETEEDSQLVRYYVNPSFKTEIDFDIDVFDKIKEKAIKLVENCTGSNEKENCINKKIVEYNAEESQKENPVYWALNCDEKESTDENIYVFCVDTNKKINNEKVIIKFALYFS